MELRVLVPVDTVATGAPNGLSSASRKVKYVPDKMRKETEKFLKKCFPCFVLYLLFKLILLVLPTNYKQGLVVNQKLLKKLYLYSRWMPAASPLPGLVVRDVLVKEHQLQKQVVDEGYPLPSILGE